ncbi:MAG: nitroreductase [Oscillospiraceae bacterium]|nr:nitroreductase [Oscillospiraceae bacterium]MDE5883582.1 nitroreductase [Oscillospiraceae bacterium]
MNTNKNAIIQAMLTRRSCRKFKPDAVPEDVLQQIIQAGTYAPTGRNMQSPVIIAVTNKQLRDRLSVLNAEFMGKTDFDPFYGAPVVLIVLADKSRPTYLYDGSLVMGNLMLAAHSEGLGSCWIHRAKEEFETDECKKILASLGITGDYEGIGHCVIGYADGALPDAPERKADYVYYIR